MSKAFKLVKYGLIIVVICWGIHFLSIAIWSHSTNWEVYKQYLWIFKDSIRSNVSPILNYSYVQKRNTYNNIHYKGSSYNVAIWEFEDLHNLELNQVVIKQNVDLDNVRFWSGETLNKKGDLKITVKFLFAFHNIMTVNLDKHSKIEQSFEGVNYKGFYGFINKLSLSNKKNEPQIILDFPWQTPTVFLLYKGHQSFFVIIINSREKFDENIINILNLE